MGTIIFIVAFAFGVYSAIKQDQSWVIAILGGIMMSTVALVGYNVMFHQNEPSKIYTTYTNKSSYRVKIYSSLCEECNRNLKRGDSFTIRGIKKVASMTAYKFTPANYVSTKTVGDTVYFVNRQ